MEGLIPIGLLHVDGIDADIEFESLDDITSYELESKE